MMANRLISTTEAAKILGISRVSVFKKIKSGEIKAEKIGRNFAVDKVQLIGNINQPDNDRKKEIVIAVSEVLKDYGEVIKRLGKE
jgi:excisionase family DNA binding protein